MMPTFSGSIAKTAKNFEGGVTGTAGAGKKVGIVISGTPQVGDKFNVKLGSRNFGFVGKPYGKVSALLTLKDKVHAAVGSIFYYCGIALPTRWDYLEDTLGAGFNNTATSSSGADSITGMEKYQGNLAVFTRWTTQVWFIDPEPAGNRQLQVLDNIGALANRSITSVGDIDSFFLSDTGVRSLRARDASNAAFVNDIGTPIDPLIIKVLRGLTEEQKAAACSVVEPEDGRYCLAIGQTVYVFSYFATAKVSAWGAYTFPSEVRWFALLAGRVYARCADGLLYLLGGSDNETYDETQAEVITPFMDARQPATHKQITGIDLGIEGEWEVDIALDPANPDAYERVARIDQPTFAMEDIPVNGISSHFKLRLRSTGAGYARLANVAVHYS